VNTAILSPSGGNIGIGFAVPSKLAHRVVESLKQSGKVERGWLGVSLQPIDRELAGALGLEEPMGAMIAGVEPGSPAARGGLRPCDLIEQVGGTAVDNPSEVQVAVDQGRVGQPLPLRVQRGPRQLNLQLRPAELPRQN